MLQSAFSEPLAYQPRCYFVDGDDTEASEQRYNLFDGDDTELSFSVSHLFSSSEASQRVGAFFPLARINSDVREISSAVT